MANQEWIAMEHYRLHTVEAWPDSPRKNASLAAIHSALGALLADSAPRREPSVAQFPSRVWLPLKPSKAA